jgi:hypothetical protein
MVSTIWRVVSSKRLSSESSSESNVLRFGGESSIGSELIADDLSGAEEKGDLYIAITGIWSGVGDHVEGGEGGGVRYSSCKVKWR